jgi:quinoprotein glucose dehydrogenase
MKTFTTIVFALVGVALLAGGLWLLRLGGSSFYLALAIGFAVTALLVWRRHPAARAVYALVIAATLAWALIESGFDWWPLGTRGGVVVLLGLWLLLPGIVRPGRHATRALVAMVIVSVLVAGAAMMHDAHRIEGTLEGAAATAQSRPPTDTDWPAYGGTAMGQRWSPLEQINRDSAPLLKTAWTYRTGDLRGADDVTETTYQVTPIKAGNLLYLCTPHSIAIALDAATGEQKWRFDPQVPKEPDRQHQTCRGVSYSAAPDAGDAPCARRIFLPTSDARLIALDAQSGALCRDFGRDGTVDLWANMPNQKKGFYYSTSPPVVARGLVIVGGAVNDNYAIASPSGVIRAFDARSGQLVWNWDSGNPQRTQPLGPEETYTANSPNSWSVSSADEELGLLYVPLGNRTPDQLGMDRSEAVERFSSSVTALDLATGQVRWVFQTVHHDLWDMDVPSQPVLIDLDLPGGRVPALVQPTKQGDVYVLDRRTGKPILPVHEVPAPKGAIEGDFTAPAQPVSALTFMPEPLTERDMWGITLFDQLACRIRFRSLRYEGRYTPPSLQGTIVYPGNFGVFNWGSVAVDPARQVMFGMPVYLAFTSQLIPSDKIPPGMRANAGEAGLNLNVGGKYGVIMKPFLSPLGLPCQQPPWGYVAGADLRTGKIAWQHRNGTIQDIAPVPLPLKLGVPGIGGPLLTAGGVAFLGAAVDDYLRAYDVDDGRVLWEQRLPAGGQSTPMTYAINGKQYVVHVAGGHGSIGTKAGDYVIAYALPGR